MPVTFLMLQLEDFIKKKRGSHLERNFLSSGFEALWLSKVCPQSLFAEGDDVTDVAFSLL